MEDIYNRIEGDADEYYSLDPFPSVPQSESNESDGGSSSYYGFVIPGVGLMQVEDIIQYMVGNDFDLGNVIKASRRIYMYSRGKGKKGTSAEYDWNKIKYTSEKRLRRIRDGIHR